MIYSLIWLVVILRKERTCFVKRSVCLDPTLCCGAVHIVWVKVVSETEVNCEKRFSEVLLCTRGVHQSKKYVYNALLLYQSTFGLLQLDWTLPSRQGDFSSGVWIESIASVLEGLFFCTIFCINCIFV